MPLSFETANEATKSEAAISYELYRICRNAIQADDTNKQAFAQFLSPHENFGEPQSDGKSTLFSENFKFVHVIPEFRISSEDRLDSLKSPKVFSETGYSETVSGAPWDD